MIWEFWVYPQKKRGVVLHILTILAFFCLQKLTNSNKSSL